MKRITILADAHIPGENPDQPETLYAGSTVDLDDSIAGQVVAAGRAKYDKDAKLKDTSKARLAEIDARASAAVSPQAELAAFVAAAVAQALKANATPAA